MDQSYTWRSENGPRGDDRENAPADVAREQTYHERQHGHLGNEGSVDGDFESWTMGTHDEGTAGFGVGAAPF